MRLPVLAALFERTPRSAATGSGKLKVEQLEDRMLPSAASVLASLQDSTLRTLAQTDYNRDASLTRNDMIGIFKAAAREGSKAVNATELSDMSTLVNNSNVLGMPAYVEDLSSKVIGSNPANVTYHGKKILPTGKLTAGQPGSKLTDLIDKWFLGKDLPTANAGGHSDPYATAKGTLFGSGGPSIFDVAQGEVGDCGLLAVLGETAARDPQAIKNMFITNGDGTYTVRFYHQVGSSQVADYVTVNSEFPEDRYGRFVYANLGQYLHSHSSVLWVALAEKAYAQLAQEGWSVTHASNSYSAIAADYCFEVMQQILGVTTPNPYYYPFVTAYVGILISDMNAGDLVTINSKLSEPASSHVIVNHGYSITAYNAGTGLFTLDNPWGAKLKTVGTLHLTASQLVKYFQEFDVDVAAV